MLIKVCGLREADNIRAVEEAGPDLMGFIFYPRSPRYVSEVPAHLPEKAGRVGVFVHPDFVEVTRRVKEYGLSAVQFHGQASAEMCQTFRERGLTVIRALPVTDTFVADTAQYTGRVDLFLFDTPTLRFGGSGRRYDWSLLGRYPGPTPFLLSGGLSPDSLDDLRTFHHPFLAGYDLNSGFETAPAVKDAAALKHFIQTIRNERHQPTVSQ